MNQINTYNHWRTQIHINKTSLLAYISIYVSIQNKIIPDDSPLKGWTIPDDNRSFSCNLPRDLRG